MADVIKYDELNTLATFDGVVVGRDDRIGKSLITQLQIERAIDAAGALEDTEEARDEAIAAAGVAGTHVTAAEAAADLAGDAQTAAGVSATAAAASASAAASSAGTAALYAAAAGGAAAENTYASRDAFALATISEPVISWSIIHNGRKLDYVRDASGTACTSANGVKGKPAGAALPEHYGAVGDGSTDDTTAVQLWAAQGGELEVRAPASYYRLTAQIEVPDDTIITGHSLPEFRQVTTGHHVFSIDGKSNVTIKGIHARANGQLSSQAFNAAISLDGSQYCKVLDCTISNHRAAGVLVFDSSYCRVSGNNFIDSPTAHLSTDTLGDISVLRQSVGNIISNNIIHSGKASGVLVQAVAALERCDRNIITGNHVYEAKAYGILCYRNESGGILGNTVFGSVISGNTIDTVYGTIMNPAVSNYSFGAGIYVQGAEDTSVTGNTVSNSHAGADIIAPATFADTLAPGGIGFANVTRFTCTGNTVANAGRVGIDVGPAGASEYPDGQSVVSSNTVTGAVLDGIRVRAHGNLTIIGNAVSETLGRGIRVVNTSSYPNISITGNMFRDTTGTAIEVTYCDGLTVSMNQIIGSGSHGINAHSSSMISVQGNVIRDFVNRGVFIANTCSGTVIVDGNLIDDGDTGIFLGIPSYIGATNRITNITTAEYSGTARTSLSLPIYADNAEAVAAGVPVGTLYVSTTGAVRSRV